MLGQVLDQGGRNGADVQFPHKITEMLLPFSGFINLHLVRKIGRQLVQNIEHIVSNCNIQVPHTAGLCGL